MMRREIEEMQAYKKVYDTYSLRKTRKKKREKAREELPNIDRETSDNKNVSNLSCEGDLMFVMLSIFQ